MRVVAFAAAALLFSAADPALAMSFFSGNGGCAKGMLWPYVRNPGDCLTDAEIQAGQRGVYTGPVNTNPDVGAMAPLPPPPQPAAAVPAYAAPPGTAYVAQPQAPAYAAPPGYAPAPGVAVQPQAVQPQGVPAVYGPPPPMAADPNIRTVSRFSCSKSALWPFVRKPGDCLTTDEKKKGQTGVYGGGSGMTVTQVSVATGAPAVIQPAAGSYVVDGTGQVVPVQPAPDTYAVDSNGQVVAVAPPPAPASCTKGTLWPFVRKPGDCPTSSEQKRK